MSPKLVWLGSRDSFLHFWARVMSLELMKLDISNLVCRLNVKSTAITRVKVLQYEVHLGSRNLLTFLEISANISETVQNRHVVTMED